MARKALIPGFRWWNIIQIESNGFPIDQFYCDITTLLCSVALAECGTELFQRALFDA